MPDSDDGVTTTGTLTRGELTLIARARRVAALAGPGQLRLVGTALLAFLFVDFVRLTLTHPVAGQAGPFLVLMDTLAYVALGLTIWRPRAGLLVAGIPLFAALFWPSTSLDGVLLVLATALALSRLNVVTGVVVSLADVAYVVARVVLQPTDRAAAATVLGACAAAGLAVGWAVLLFRRRRDAREGESLSRVRLTARIRSDERRLLSRELHDVLAHQLSTASLQIMGARATDDLAAAHRSLDTIDRVTAEALTELRLLVRVLRDDASTAVSGTEIRELAERVPPTQAVAAVSRRLTSAGWEARLRVPASADDVEMTVQRTVSRALTEAADRVLAGTGSDGLFAAKVEVEELFVKLHVSATPAPSAEGDEDPFEALAQRVDLTGGQWRAQVTADSLEIDMILPRG